MPPSPLQPGHLTFSMPNSAASPRSGKKQPLLSLAPPAIALGDELEVGEPGEDSNLGEIWNVITRAADLVKDGERLENLAWRHWGSPRRTEIARRQSSSSMSDNSSHLYTPPSPLPTFMRRHSAEKRTFGASLKLLLEPPQASPTTSAHGELTTPQATFKDWVTDAKRNLPIPTLSVPDTPVADVEIRLVEPTPVPSRVGSLGGSLATGGLFGSAVVPPRLNEEEEEEELMEDVEDGEGVVIKPITTTAQPRMASHNRPPRSPRTKGKFFVHSSPSKGSVSDSSHPSPVVPPERVLQTSSMPRPDTTDSGDSSGGILIRSKVDKGKGKAEGEEREDNPIVAKKPERHVSLSTMKGKYTAEKRKAAEALKAKEEDSGWEDEEEDGGEEEDEVEEEGDWSDEPDSQEKPKRALIVKQPHPQIHPEHPQARHRSDSRDRRSSSTLDISALLTRQKSRTGNTPPRETPPPPAPTPLRKMSKKERLAAAAERAKIEAELDAQRKREMFAKQEIFGKKPVRGQGLLTGMFKTGGSMIDLTRAPELQRREIRPSPTHGHLPSLSRSPSPAPTLLRSKSAVAMPVQTGVSVTIPPHAMGTHGSRHSSQERSSKGSKGSEERRVPVDVVMESSDEDESGEDDYLATSETQRKIAELSAKKDAKDAKDAKAQPVPTSIRLDEQGIIQPLSPTSRRRRIIMNEMSESLRRNLIIERQKSSGGTSRHNSFGQAHSRPPPSTHTSVLPARNSAVDLQQYAHGAPLERHRSEPRMQQPKPQMSSLNNPSPPPLPPLTGSSSPAPSSQPHPPRRPGSTVLGGGFLRPLTRVGNNLSPISRTQSSATLVTPVIAQGPSLLAHTKSPSPLGGGERGYEAPAMMRRSTEGDPRDLGGSEQRKRELARRSDTMDTSYRAHGW